MSCHLHRTVLILLLLILPQATGAFPWSGRDGGGSRTRRDVHCKDFVEYLNGDICCQSCPAGSRMISPCTTAGTKGTCEECDDGTYTQHANSLTHCFKCTQCRSDQEIVRACTHTQDTECRCKSGQFCAPDQACEVCKKCSRCKIKDEEIVRNCTSTANTECKKIQPKAPSDSGKASVIVPLVLVSIVVFGLVVFFVCRHHRAKDSQRNVTDELKVGQVDEPFPRLVPLNGVESLKQCFDYFEDLDFNYHKRFFRHLGITDNKINSKDHLQYEDRIHELLNVWVEKEGKEASLNDLLKSLLDLNQRQTAEKIKDRAVKGGHYVCEDCDS